MKTKKEDLRQESFDFIMKNLDITTNLIPQKLLENWLAEDDDDDNNDCPLQIFLMAYCFFLVRKTRSATVTLEETETLCIFSKFQTMLNLEVLRRKQLFDIETNKIFDFDNYDTITISVDPNKLPLFEAIVEQHKDLLS